MMSKKSYKRSGARGIYRKCSSQVEAKGAGTEMWRLEEGRCF